jgi:hypothetical protein
MVMKFEFIVMWKEAIVKHLNKSPGDREAKEKKPLRDLSSHSNVLLRKLES